jgi:putative pyrroloquinoline-quinone binding quinoprotein/beta-propeller repeat-containing protein
MKPKHLNRIRSAILLMALGSGAAFAETVTEKWNGSYDGPAHAGDTMGAIAVDGFGNVFATGTIAEYSSGYLYGNWATLKYSPSGTRRWVVTYDGPSKNRDNPNDIALDDRGNSYVTGYSLDSGCRTAKYDADGSQLWATSYPGECTSIAYDEDGHLYVAGRSQQQDLLLIKYGTDGVQQWVRTYAGPAGMVESGARVKVDSLGQPVVVALSQRADYSNSFVVAKYDLLGNPLWTQRIDTVQALFDPSMAVDDDDNVVIAGSISSNGAMDAFVAKFSPQGQQLWQSVWNGPANLFDRAEAVTVDTAGDVIIAGYSNGSNLYIGAAMTTVKFSGATGSVQWAKTAGSPTSSGRAMGITTDSGGNVYAVGAAGGARIVKYSTTGSTLWESVQTGGFLTKVGLDAKGCVVAGGQRNSDLFVIKLCQEGGLVCN